MRVVLAIAFCVVVAWGMVSLFATNKPISAAPATMAQDLDPQKVEQNMVKAAGWLETSPCDSKYRESLHQAVVTYVNVVRAGKLSVDKASNDIIRDAMLANVVRAEEIGATPVSETTVSHVGGYKITLTHHSAYACRSDGDAGNDSRRSQAVPDLPENAGR